MGQLSQHPARLTLSVLAGLAVLGILAALPVVGGIAALLALSTGLGGVWISAAHALHRPTPAVPVTSRMPLTAPSAA